MQTYRAYLLNAEGKIIWADWLEAPSEEVALEKAHALCNEGTPTVELWQGERRLAELPCAD